MLRSRVNDECNYRYRAMGKKWKWISFSFRSHCYCNLIALAYRVLGELVLASDAEDTSLALCALVPTYGLLERSLLRTPCSGIVQAAANGCIKLECQLPLQGVASLPRCIHAYIYLGLVLGAE